MLHSQSCEDSADCANRQLVTLQCCLQGTADEVIDVCHGRTLHKLAQRASMPLFLEGYTHDDVETSPDYLPALRRFMMEIFPELKY